MKNIFFILSGIVLFQSLGMKYCMTSSKSAIGQPLNLIAPPESESDSTITLLWDKPINATSSLDYQVFQYGKPIMNVNKTNCTVSGLTPGNLYTFYVKAMDAEGQFSEASNQLIHSTKEKGQIFNILTFGAVGDGITKNTQAIQKAIDECTQGGTVYIPAGIFVSGALFLKSNMTLYIADGGVLKGSYDIVDYYPLISSRFEGWELKSFASLITVGEMNHAGGYKVTNLSIRGKGTISGGGTPLGQAMIKAEGLRGRGRLICLMNCENVNIQGLTVQDSPCWTIHYIYCKNITCHDLTIRSTVMNGDGIDPDSSTNSYIFNCSFSTGDDCIAIKSGKNPEGYKIGRPTENVLISNCKFIVGHSLAIGSEMSGGVKNVVIRDCQLGNLMAGFQIKVTKDRGGYVEGIKVSDCDLQKIRIVTAVSYNNDGVPAPKLPWLKDMEFSNLIMTKADTSQSVIFVDGFQDITNYTSNIIFRNIQLPKHATVSLKYCKDITFQNVKTSQNEKPIFKVSNSANIND